LEIISINFKMILKICNKMTFIINSENIYKITVLEKMNKKNKIHFIKASNIIMYLKFVIKFYKSIKNLKTES
jgi:hypothetical protein